jgi:hypothetical protein
MQEIKSNINDLKEKVDHSLSQMSKHDQENEEEDFSRSERFSKESLK